MNVVAAFFAVIWLSGCTDTTMPEPRAAPTAGPAVDFRMGTVTVVGQCDPWLSLDWCKPAEECLEILAANATPVTWSSTCGSTGGGVGTGGGGPGGTGTGGSTGGSGTSVPGDADGDGDTLDDGPGAFAICMAAKLGVDGWAALVGAGWSAYQAWDRRQDTREAYTRYMLYHERWDIPGSDYDPAVDRLFYQMWQEAVSDENLMYTALAGSSTYAAGKFLIAAGFCAPTALAPTA